MPDISSGAVVARAALILALWALCAPAQAMQCGPYLARYLQNYDGDTVTLQILIWPDLRKLENVRLRGVDAPEIRGGCEREKRKAREAREFVRNTLNGKALTVVVHGFDKYGRALGDVRVGDLNIAQALIDNDLARSYDGGPRLSWCGTEG